MGNARNLHSKTYLKWKIVPQYFTVKMDPRVKTSMKDLQLQHDLSLLCYNNTQTAMKALKNNGAKN
jgi:hypothetical protein